MRAAVFIVMILLVFMVPQYALPIPTAEAVPPRAIATFSGTVLPANFTLNDWELNQGIQEFIFYYRITGGPEPFDVAYVSIDGTSLYWPQGTSGGLKGEGWSYCDCALDPDLYTVIVDSDANATATISFVIGFYNVPQPPVEFSGEVLADSDVRISDFGVRFPGGNHTLIFEVTSGEYEFYVDGLSLWNSSQTRELNTNFTRGFHLLEVLAVEEQNVGWSVQIQGQPKLEVNILTACQPINLSLPNPVCLTGARAFASDGGQPNVTYQWTDNGAGGVFNSTNSQWVAWTPPSMAGNYRLTVTVSAPGYLSDNADLIPVQVVPEFPSMAPMLLVTFMLAVALAAQRSKKSLVKYR